MNIDVEELYRDLHSHPELSFQEVRTARIVSGHLHDLGFLVHQNVGQTGVVGVLDNGPGAVVLLRADMDGLPVEEATGLDYASTVRSLDQDGIEVPVMHACGHDVHVACLMGAVAKLATERNDWSGTLVAVFSRRKNVAVARRPWSRRDSMTWCPSPTSFWASMWDRFRPAGSVSVLA